MSEQTKSRSASQGTLLWRISKKFNFAAEKIIPDSFVFCVILMLAVFVLSLLLCGKSPLDLLIAWWNGLSSQLSPPPAPAAPRPRSCSTKSPVW